jgi:hypothetical protein
MNPRTLLWIVVLLVAGIVLVRYKQGGAKPAHTLAAAAVPVAAAYARDVVSSRRCADAKSLAHPGIGDPCKTFAALQRERVTGSGRIVRACAAASEKIPSSAQGDDCVRFPLAGPQGRGTLDVWLERHGSGWRVAAAVSEVHA